MKPIYIKASNIFSPLGFTTEENMEAVVNGKSGLTYTVNPSLSPEPVCASLINTALLNNTFSKIGLPDSYTRFEKLCLLSISAALKNTNIDAESNKTLFLFSTTKGSIDVLDAKNGSLFSDDRLYLWKSAQVVSSFFNNPNVPIVISNACISGVLGVITAARLIRNGIYENIVVCGADIITKFVVSGFQSFKALSSTACKPFDEDRNGLNLGEGAGTIILSSVPEKGKIVVGEGFSSNDATHISAPSRTGEGLLQVISKLLQTQAGTTQNPIDFISAHGTATLYNDEMEATAISSAGLESIAVNSFKAYWGHTLGAAGTIETIATAYAMQHNLLIKSLGFENQGTTNKVNIIQDTQQANLQTCMKLASGFGGCNAGLLLFKQND